MQTLALDDDYKDDGFESGGEKSEEAPIKTEADNLIESAVEVINDESIAIAIEESALQEE